MKAIGVLIVAAMLDALPVEARIVCNGNYQQVGGSEISTPYCRDQNLARIARRSGFEVSDGEIRSNPSRKREICRYIGSDIEAQVACADVGIGSGRDSR